MFNYLWNYLNYYSLFHLFLIFSPHIYQRNLCILSYLGAKRFCPVVEIENSAWNLEMRCLSSSLGKENRAKYYNLFPKKLCHYKILLRRNCGGIYKPDLAVPGELFYCSLLTDDKLWKYLYWLLSCCCLVVSNCSSKSFEIWICYPNTHQIAT